VKYYCPVRRIIKLKSWGRSQAEVVISVSCSWFNWVSPRGGRFWSRVRDAERRQPKPLHLPLCFGGFGVLPGEEAAGGYTKEQSWNLLKCPRTARRRSHVGKTSHVSFMAPVICRRRCPVAWERPCPLLSAGDAPVRVRARWFWRGGFLSGEESVLETAGGEGKENLPCYEASWLLSVFWPN